MSQQWARPMTLPEGGTGTAAFTGDRVVVSNAGATALVDDSGLRWDNANNRLGIALTAAPIACLQVVDDTTGSTTLGNPSTNLINTGEGPLFYNNIQVQLNLLTSVSTPVLASHLIFRKSRGSITTPTIVSSGDRIGGLLFMGFDGTNPVLTSGSTAIILAEVDGATAANQVPGRLLFQTSQTNLGGIATRLTIKAAGQVIIGPDQTALGKLHVDGESDIVQLVVQGHSTQTNNIVLIETSAGTDLVTINNAGTISMVNLVITGTTNNAVNLGHGAVSQATNINTGVTVNAASGVITTQTATTAALTAETGFTVTCGACGSGSTVIAQVTDYSGTLMTNGFPAVVVTTVANGSFTVKVVNQHPTNALNGTMKIRYAVV